MNIVGIEAKVVTSILVKIYIRYRHCLRLHWNIGNLMLDDHIIEMSLQSFLWLGAVQTWWDILGRLGFGCWLGDIWKSIIFNIIIRGGNLILMQHMLDKCYELFKFRDKFINFLISIFVFGINISLHEEEMVIQTWHIENYNCFVCDVVTMRLC